MREHNFNRIKIYFILFFFLSTGVFSFAQTCTTIVGGSHFVPIAGYENNFYNLLTHVEQQGVSGNSLSSPAAFPTAGTDFDGTKFVAAVTSNPSKLNASYLDIEDSMLVVTMNTNTRSQLFSYTVNGLKPGSAYSIKLKYYILPMIGSACEKANQYTDIRLRIGVSTNGRVDGIQEVNLGRSPAAWGKLFTPTFTGNVGANDNSVTFEMYTGDQSLNCAAIGISDIQVTGCLDPWIKSSQGKEVCSGEQTLLNLDREYNASSYLWEKSINGGTNWTTISTNKSVTSEIKENSIFRATVDGMKTPNYTITTVTCCMVNGTPTSRENLFFENFGYFTGPHDYVNASGVASTTPANQRPFRANTVVPIPLHQYDATNDNVPDGWYAVTSNPLKYAANWTWATTDHTQNEQNGGVLLINIGTLQKFILYTRTITNLCPGKELFFEAFVANANENQANTPIIRLSLYDNTTNAVLFQTPITTLPQYGRWQRVNTSFTLAAGSSAVRFEVESNNITGGNGNDLLIDDIRIMACAPPSLDLYADKTALLKEIGVCSDPLTFGFTPTTLLTNFYGGTPQYLLQWSKTPTVQASWKNIGTPGTATTFSIPDPTVFTAGLNNGDKVYFRVIAAMPSLFASTVNFTSQIADPNDHCKNYTISPEITITDNCPRCSQPTSVTVSSNPVAVAASGSNPKTVTVCSGSAITLNGTYFANPTPPLNGIKYVWYKKGTPLGTYSTLPITAKTLTGNMTDAGTWVLRVEDGYAGNTSCFKEDSIKVVINVIPSIAAPSTGKVCSGASFSSGAITINPAADVTFDWTRAVVAGISNATGSGTGVSPSIGITETLYNTTNTSIVVRFVLTPKTATCTGTAFNLDVSINPLPTLDLGTAQTVCKDDTVTLNAITNATSYLWSNDNQTALSSTNTAKIETSLINKTINSNESHTYTVTVTDDNSCITTGTVVITYESICRPYAYLKSDKAVICFGETTNVWVETKSQKPLKTLMWSEPTYNPAPLVAIGSKHSITPSTDVIYTVTVTDIDDKSNTDHITIKVNPLPIATVNDIGVCKGDTGVLTAMGAPNFLWSTSENTQSITVSPTQTTTYTATVTDANGCSASDSTVVIVSPRPTVTINPILPDDLKICFGDNITLTAACSDNPISYLWTTTNITPVITVNPTSTTDYIITATNTATHCFNIAQVTVIVIQPPAPPEIPTSVVCKANKMSSTLFIMNPNKDYTYVWYASTTDLTPIDTGTSYSMPNVIQDITFYVKVYSLEGCPSQTLGTGMFRVANTPQSSFTYSPNTIYENRNVYFTNNSVSNSSSLNYSSNWNFGKGEGYSTLKDPTYIFRDTGLYTVRLTITNSDGCKDTISDLLKVNKLLQLWVPDVFTPNDDMKNDVLYVRGPVKTMNFEVWNQWGYKIFETDDPMQGWDGKYKGADQPEGNYFWKLTAVSIDGADFKLEGLILLAR